MRIPILASLVIASSAAAQPQPILAAAERAVPVEPSKLRFGTVDGGSITYLGVTARAHPGHVHVTMTMALATRSKELREVALLLATSSQVGVIGLGLDTAEGTEVGYATEPAAARSTYESIVATIKDPALLEQIAPGKLALKVFPVSRDVPATITMELALPYGAPLVIERGASGIRDIDIDLDGQEEHHLLGARRMIPLTDAIEEHALETDMPAVGATVSLIARPQDRRHLVVMPRGFHERERFVPTTIDLLGDRDVAKAVNLRKEELGRCFSLGYERSASLLITIAKDGEVTSVSADDLEHERSRDCIVREVTAWKFGASRRSRTLRHALELSPDTVPGPAAASAASER